MPTAAIGIMCKAPRAGHSKTRLAALVGAEAAAGLAACFLRDLARTIESIPEQLGRKGYAVYAPAGARADLRSLLPGSFDFLLLDDPRFENVLHGAIGDLLEAGHDCAVLVNADSPTLPCAYVTDAIELLRRPGDRLVLGPASDGGYYLIGLKRPHRHLFTNIPWGTDAVARLTLLRAAEIGLEAVLLPEWYDIDDGETLGWLRDELAGGSSRFKEGGNAPVTHAFLATMLLASQ
jgi:rSAM/selenodomain-associated transferase 1